MSQELTQDPEYQATMRRLEEAKHLTSKGVEFWFAREIHPILGYPNWREFEVVIKRASDAFVGNGIDPSHQIVPTRKLMGVAKGGSKEGIDYFLSRSACYLIAINGDPAKPEIAAAQVYFTIQTRRMEVADTQHEEDSKRIELREKVSRSFRKVSGVAQDAGVPNHLQGVFHDARYKGLYSMGLRDVKVRKGLNPKDQLFDFAGPLELSANDFQMNLAADVIARENITGQQRVIRTNEDVGRRVRKAMEDSGAALPENLPLAGSIKDVKKRLAQRKKLPKD